MNQLGSEGATALAKALEVNTTLAKLDLGINKIEDKGATALAEALKVNTTLDELDFNYSNIGDEGATELAKALKVNTSVTKLDLSYNNIGDKGAQAIAEALKVNTTITKLNSYNHRITDQQIKTDIKNLLERNNKIKTIKDSLLKGAMIERKEEDQCSINNTIYDKEVVALAIEAMFKERLIIAIYKGDLDKVERLCKDYANSYIHGTSILERAVKIGHIEIVKCLLDNGAEVDKANNHGDTLLHIAAQKGHHNIVRLLFDYGADSTVFIDKEKTSFFRTTYVKSFYTYLHDVKKVIEEISTKKAILERNKDTQFLRLQKKKETQKKLDEIQKPEIDKLKEELKSYLDPYDDKWRNSFYHLTTFSSDTSLPYFTKEDLNQLFKDKTFKSILLLNHTDSIADEFSVIEKKEIFKIAKAEYNISDDDEKKYEEYKEKYKTDNGIDIKHVIYDMLKIKISAPPREEPSQTLTSRSSTTELIRKNGVRPLTPPQ